MIGKEDAPFTYEYNNYYKILPSINNFYLDKYRIKNGKKVNNDFSYSSDNNKEWMKINELKKWIKENYN